MTWVGLTWADDEGQGDTREDILFNNNDEWINGKEGRGGSPQAIAAKQETCCVPPAPSLSWKQTTVHGFSPPLISLTVSTSPSLCSKHAPARRPAAYKTNWIGVLFPLWPLSRAAVCDAPPHNDSATSEVNTFFFCLVFNVYTCMC